MESVQFPVMSLEFDEPCHLYEHRNWTRFLLMEFLYLTVFVFRYLLDVGLCEAEIVDTLFPLKLLPGTNAKMNTVQDAFKLRYFLSLLRTILSLHRIPTESSQLSITEHSFSV